MEPIEYLVVCCVHVYLLYFSFSILNLFTLTLAKNASSVYYSSREFYGMNYHRPLEIL